MRAGRIVAVANGTDEGSDSDMITGVHLIIYSKDVEADRAFFRDVLGLSSVDAGHGWLIFRLPPAEGAFHPAEENDRHEAYLLCDDVRSEVASLGAKGVKCGELMERPWGLLTTVPLPGGGKLGLYEPRHPTAIES
jgi:catechol 2,3-dioxygenase-like lactoylglutathione lyase family enzyme